MKILTSDINRYVPQQRLVDRVKLSTGIVSGEAGGAFSLTEYKGDKILSVLDAIVPIVETVANVVLKGANYYKELRGNGIEPEALAEVLKERTQSRQRRLTQPKKLLLKKLLLKQELGSSI